MGAIGYSRKRFVQHLRALDPGMIVGTRCRSGDCPLSKEIERCGGRFASVNVNQIAYGVEGRVRRVIRGPSLWEYNFIIDIDGKEYYDGPLDTVTAQEALTALGEG